jgi:hypothetical protein
LGGTQERRTASRGYFVDGVDVFVTVDQRLRYQQNIGRLSVGVVVIETFDTTLANLRTMLPQLRAAIEGTPPGAITLVKPA